MNRRLLQLFLLLLLLAENSFAQNPVPGPNVSIVTYDPFFQKKVEVFARPNPLHPEQKFAGYINYVTGSEDASDRVTARARCGYSWSNGVTWKSGLVRLTIPDAQVLKCGDPSVAWNFNQQAFYMYLLDLSDGTSRIQVASFTVPDNGGDPIQADPVELDQGTPNADPNGQVLDYTYMTHMPDLTPGASPNAAGTLYACNSNFVGTSSNNRKVECFISNDYGRTWSVNHLNNLNGNIKSNNLVNGSAGPNGSIYLAWRAFDPGELGFYFVQVFPNGSATPVKQILGPAILSGAQYDQPTLQNLARVKMSPMVVSDISNGKQWVGVFFQAYSKNGLLDRNPSGNSSPHIFGIYSNDGGITWSSPLGAGIPQAIDPGPAGAVNTAHQIFPAATFFGGRVGVLYYDARNDKCFEQESSNPSGCGRSLDPVVDADGVTRYYPTDRAGERRRRFDVRVIQGKVNASGYVDWAPSSTQVTRYETNATPGPTLHQILGYGFINEPIAARGTKSFAGDFISYTAKTTWVRTNVPAVQAATAIDSKTDEALTSAATSSSIPPWRYTADGDPLTTYAFWVGFQGVVPPNGNTVYPVNGQDGDWTNFIPACPPGTPLTQPCTCFNERSRHTQIMFSEIAIAGLSVNVRGTTQLPTANGVLIRPKFSANVSNQSGGTLNVRLEVVDAARAIPSIPSEDWTVSSSPDPTNASLLVDVNVVDLRLLNNSSVSEDVFYRLTNTSPSAPVLIKVYEINAVGGQPKSGGLSTSASYYPSSSQFSICPPGQPCPAAQGLSLSDPVFESFSSPLSQPSSSATESSATESSATESSATESSAIPSSALPDGQARWSVTNKGALDTSGLLITNVVGAGNLIQNAHKTFQVLLYLTQFNPGVKACHVVTRATDIILSNIPITNGSILNWQVASSATESSATESSATESSATESAATESSATESSTILEQFDDATFSAGTDPVNIVVRSFNTGSSLQMASKTEGPLVFADTTTPTFTPTTVGATIFGQVPVDPVTGTRVSAFYDTDAPIIIPRITGTLGNNGWYVSDVTVSWLATDPQSGVDPATKTGCGPVTLTADTSGTTLTCSATNRVGMSNSGSITIKIDKTPPTITSTITPQSPAATGWYNIATGKPTVNFICSDAAGGSGLAGSCPAAVLVGDGANQSITGSVSDLAGNTSSTTRFPISVDTVAPVIAITAPANNATYILNQSVASNYSCTDATSGVLNTSCKGPVANGSNFSTSTAGSNSFTVNATDVAGNPATATTNTYFVVYNFILTPAKSPAKWGSSEPLIWQLTDASGVTINNDLSSLIALTAHFTPGVQPVNGVCPITYPGTTQFQLHSPTTGDKGGSSFRWISSSLSYQYNVDTKVLTTGVGCYTFVWLLKDNAGPAPGYIILNPSQLKKTSVQLN